MKTTEQLIKETQTRLMETQEKLTELEEQLKAEQSTKLLFPIDTPYMIHTGTLAHTSSLGMTAYSKEENRARAAALKARAYCLERINQENKGDNGFKMGNVNHTLYWDVRRKAINYYVDEYYQSQCSEEYLRTSASAITLIQDEEFVKRWKIWKQCYD